MQAPRFKYWRPTWGGTRRSLCCLSLLQQRRLVWINWLHCRLKEKPTTPFTEGSRVAFVLVSEKSNERLKFNICSACMLLPCEYCKLFNHQLIIIQWLFDFLLSVVWKKIPEQFLEKCFLKNTVSAAGSGGSSGGDWEAADTRMKIPQFTQRDIVFYVIHKNFPAGDFTSFKSRTICRGLLKGRISVCCCILI